MGRYFVVDNITGLVTNQVDWNGLDDYSASYPGSTLYRVEDGGQVGYYRLVGGSFQTTTMAILKRQMRDAVNTRVAAQFQKGYSPSTGPIAGHTLQCRDTEDRTNWLTSQTSYMAAIQLGYALVKGAVFRTADNVTITLTFQQGLEVLTNGMATWGKNVMAYSWTLKDRIEAAATADDLAAIDIDNGWPQA